MIQQTLDNKSKEEEQEKPVTSKDSLETGYELGAKASERIVSIKKRLEELYVKRKVLKKQLKEKKEVLAPVPRSQKKTHVLQKFESPTAIDRKLFKAEKEDLKNQIILLDDHIFGLEKKYKALIDSTIAELKKQQVLNKVNSRLYISKNPHLFRAKLLIALNAIIRENKSEALELKKMAGDFTEEGRKLFRDKFKHVLYEVDKTDYNFIATSLISKELFIIAQDNISRWDTYITEIEELQDPDDREYYETVIQPEEDFEADEEKQDGE